MSESNDFTGKVILVTGASRGIGFAIAQAFAERDGIVIMVAQSSTIFEAADKISKNNLFNIYPYIVDISVYEEVDELIDLIVNRFGKIDVLVNCAAIIGATGPLDESDPLIWVETINVNLIGTFNLLSLVVTQMKKQGHGSIVNFSGGGAAGPSPNFSAYGCSKAAVVRLTETVAQELIGTPIRVNVIAPGANETDMYKTFIKAGGIARTVVTIDKPVRLTLFLASDKSKHLTGKFLHVLDDYENLSDIKNKNDVFTLRRVEL